MIDLQSGVERVFLQNGPFPVTPWVNTFISMDGDSSTYWIFLRWTSQGTNVSFRQEAWIPDRKFVCLELNEKEEDIIIDFFFYS